MGLKGFVEGGIASVVAGCATHPLDLIKVRMQLYGELIPFSAAAALRAAFAFPSPAAASISLPHPGPISVGAHILRSEGPAALFSGVSAAVLRLALYSTTSMGLYDVFKISWSTDPAGSLPLHLKIAAGLAAGGIGAAIGNPADVATAGRRPPAPLSAAELYRRLRCHPADGVAGGSSLPLARFIAYGELRHDLDSVTAGDL